MVDARELQAVLAWSSLPFVGERSLLALMNHAREGRSTLAELWTAPVEDLARIVRLHPRTRAALEEDAAAYRRRSEADAAEVCTRGVDLLLPSQPDTPAALRAGEMPRRWPLLFAYGALGLLEEPRVTLANSRSVSNSGLAVTDALADALARRDVPLVASTNREAYRTAAIAAKRHAGPSVLVVDRGIAEAFPAGLEREPVAPARVWDEQFDPNLQLLLSPFGWREHWSPRAGPRRDALVFDLSDVVVAVEVRSGGVIDRECRRAAGEGKPVLALDRGAETEPGTRRLWEEAPGAVRVAWTDAERAAGEVLRALPGERAEATEDRAESGWQREVGQFLARACATISSNGAAAPGFRRTVGAFPATGPVAQVAAAWTSRGGDATAGMTWLLADLHSGGGNAPARLVQLLERVSRGGLLAAVVPAAWLESEELAAARGRWLERAALRFAARLPLLPGAGGEAAAAILLERDGVPRAPAPGFAPERDRMGRFHLRRYLQEVLAALSGR